MKARPRCTCEANATERTYGPFLDDPSTIAKADGPRARWPTGTLFLPRLGYFSFVIDKRCPLLRRRRGGKLLEARILSERIERRIESEQRRSERQVFVQRALARHRE